LGIAGTAVAAPTISEATGFPQASESTGLTSINITPAHVGDLVILTSQIHSQTITVTGVASADTGTWQHAESYVDGVNHVITEEIWWAVATATTAATPVTVTYSGSVAALTPELVVDSYTASLASTWSAVAGNGTAATAVTTITYPTVTSGSGTGVSQLYWGYAESTQAASAGSTVGFSYAATPDAEGNLITDDPALAATTAYTPTASQTGGNTTSIAEIFAATQNPVTVTFSNNGGAGSLTAETDNAPTALSLFSTGNMTLAGSHFTGWNTLAGGGGTAYADGAVYPFTASTTLYAQWTVNTSNTVTFSNNGGAGTLAAETDNVPTALSLFSTGNMTLAGSHFTGWNTLAGGGGTAYADGATYPFTASTTLYAQWASNGGTFTVTFNNNGGQGTLAPESASSPTALSLFGTGNMTQTNSYFIGWNTSAMGTGTYYTDGAIYPFTSSVTLYAEWDLVNTGPSLLPLGITAATSTVSFGSPYTPSATVTAGLTAGDTAVVSGSTFTYSGISPTIYASSTTAPTAAGTYSVKPSGSTVTVTPAADQKKYSTTYAYVSGELTITAPTLSVTASNVSIKVGGTVSPSSSVSGLVGTDTATATATYTYTGTGSTTYAASITAPTAAGTYSITPSAATVTVTPAADATDYGTNYTYVAGSLTITANPKPPVALHASRVIGSIVPGHRVKITIVGTGFSGRPKVTSSSHGTVVVDSNVTGTRLTVWVTVPSSTKPGHATLTIRLANGKTCKIGYVIK
jgi:hypothetical protein